MGKWHQCGDKVGDNEANNAVGKRHHNGDKGCGTATEIWRAGDGEQNKAETIQSIERKWENPGSTM